MYYLCACIIFPNSEVSVKPIALRELLPFVRATHESPLGFQTEHNVRIHMMILIFFFDLRLNKRLSKQS